MRLLDCLFVFLLLGSSFVFGQSPGRLAWAPPELSEPITVVVDETKADLRLKPGRDYLIKMPSAPLRVNGGLVIVGGRNVVLIGGAIEAPSATDAPEGKERRALYLKGQTGTIHIEGLHLGGADLAEAINLDQRFGAIVQLQNIRVETVHGSFAGHHADIVQTWAGPAELRIDRMTGSTGYQGFFLLPNQHFQEGPSPVKFDFRRINLAGNEESAYLLWIQTEPRFPVVIEDVYVSPNFKKTRRDQFLWPKPSTGDRTWDQVKVGAPSNGDFVPGGVAGTAYVSPGYLGVGD